MKNSILSVLSACCVMGATVLEANTSVRQWACADGGSFKAQVIHWDYETDIVTLSTDDEESITVKRTDLSMNDQAYVRQWYTQSQKLDQKVTEMGGKLEFLQTTGADKIDFYVYKPSGYIGDGSDPMMILFACNGRGYRMMLRHFEAAEKTGMALVTMDYFSNYTLDYYDQHGLKKVSEEKFRNMLPQLETIPHDPNKLFLGGDSGGALRAYMYSAIFDRPWAGIYANAGWMGRDYTMQCREGMRVAMVNGHKDEHCVREAKKDIPYLAEQRGCEVAVFSFEGGHQLAPVESQIESFNWLLGKEEEKESK